LSADFLDLGLAIFGHGPIAFKAADMAHEIGKQLAAIGCVDDLWVELGAVEFAGLIRDHRKGRAIAGRDNFKSGGKFGDFIAVAHPYLMPLTLGPHAIEQGAFFGYGQIGAAKFPTLSRFVTGPHFAAQLVAHHLLAITNAKDRDPCLKETLGSARGSIIGDTGRRAGEDDSLGLHPPERFLCCREGCDLGIDPRLAHTARDQLGHLAAEIDDEDGFGKGRVRWGVGLHGVCVKRARAGLSSMASSHPTALSTAVATRKAIELQKTHQNYVFSHLSFMQSNNI